MGRPVIGAAFAAAALIVTLGGCSMLPVACPAIGWTNTVEVRVPGSAAPGSPVREVAFCGGRDCTPPTAADGTSPTAPVPSGATPAAPSSATPLTAGPEPTAIPWPFGRTTEHDGDTWSVVTEMATPERGRIALRNREGATIIERSVRLTWERHGGSEQCGGPSTTQATVTP